MLFLYFNVNKIYRIRKQTVSLYRVATIETTLFWSLYIELFKVKTSYCLRLLFKTLKKQRFVRQKIHTHRKKNVV